jgi:hypothetical protein
MWSANLIRELAGSSSAFEGPATYSSIRVAVGSSSCRIPKGELGVGLVAAIRREAGL